MMALARNSSRSLWIGMMDSSVCKIQYRKKHSKPAESIPASAGRWFGNVLKPGQIASMQFCRKPPACTHRIAVHIIATNARRRTS